MCSHILHNIREKLVGTRGGGGGMIYQAQNVTSWRARTLAFGVLVCFWGRLDLAVLFTPSTPNRQNRNQVRWNICAGVRRSTPSPEVV